MWRYAAVPAPLAGPSRLFSRPGRSRPAGAGFLEQREPSPPIWTGLASRPALTGPDGPDRPDGPWPAL